MSELLKGGYVKPSSPYLIGECGGPVFTSEQMKKVKESAGEQVKVNVGTIGHVDHGRTTIANEIARYIAGLQA